MRWGREGRVERSERIRRREGRGGDGEVRPVEVREKRRCFV